MPHNTTVFNSKGLLIHVNITCCSPLVTENNVHVISASLLYFKVLFLGKKNYNNHNLRTMQKGLLYVSCMEWNLFLQC